MSYCLNPNCPQPQNSEAQKFCRTCNSKLLLQDRYRAIKPIGEKGLNRIFLAVDESSPLKSSCAIEQFLLQNKGIQTDQKTNDLFEQKASRLKKISEHGCLPTILAYFIQENKQDLIREFIERQ